MKIGDKLTYLRNSNNLSQAELAKKLNISRSSIGMFESNARIPTTDTLVRYAQFFEVSLDYLLGNKRPVKGKDYTTINVYGLVPAGIPLEAIEEILDTEDISFQDGYSPYEEYMGLRVDGDSMYPKYLDGDTIIIEVTPDCENGEDCVVYVNGYDATLKTVIKNDNGTITLKPINPEYPPRTYNPKEEEIKILGKVKELRRRV